MLGLSNETDPLSSFDPDSRGKKSQNTTECVPVPSSEHVAEIVGRQGKIILYQSCHIDTTAIDTVFCVDGESAGLNSDLKCPVFILSVKEHKMTEERFLPFLVEEEDPRKEVLSKRECCSGS
jgi:hypothetical protein